MIAMRMVGRKIRKANKVAALVTVAAGMALGGLATAAPAQAATCSGDSCIAQYPRTTGCNEGANTVDSYTLPHLAVTLRHSSDCGTFWALGTTDLAKNITVWIDQYNANGDLIHEFYRDVQGPVKNIDTAMVANHANDAVVACVKFDSSQDYYCTDFH